MSKVWLITGCSTGFGRAIANEAIARGDLVMATARSPEQMGDIAARAPERVRTCRLDVDSAEQSRNAVGACVSTFGRIDVLVCNAGYGLIGAIEECSDQQVRANLETNFFGPLALIRAALPVFRGQRGGHVIAMSAAAAISNYAGFAAYGAAKLALEGACEALAAEAGPLGVKVTIVQPGPFRTDFIARSLRRADASIEDYKATSGKFAALLGTMSGKQPGDPAKAAKVIADVASADKPPLRLVLGKYAIQKARRQLAARAAELDAWQDAGIATDH